jgi:MFS family permease
MQNLFYIPKYKELDEIILCYIIRNFGYALFSIFIPVYLWTLGYSIEAIAGFFAVYFLFIAIGFPVFAKIAAKIGLKRTITFYVPLFIIVFYMLQTIQTLGWPLWLIAIVFGLGQASFWLPYHVVFSKFSDHEHRGRILGLNESATYFLSIVAPLVGGLIIAMFGFPTLFVAASVVLIVSVIPLFMSKEVFEPIKFNFSDLFSRRSKKFFSVTFGQGMKDSSLVLFWPLFIFIILGSALSLGLIYSLAAFFVILIVIYIGKVTDLKDKRILFKWGSIIESLSFFVRGFTFTGIQIFLSDFVGKIGMYMKGIPYSCVFYDKTNKEKRVEFIIFTEFYLNAGRILVLLLIILLPFAFMEKLILSFFLAGIGSLFFLAYSKKLD